MDEQFVRIGDNKFPILWLEQWQRLQVIDDLRTTLNNDNLTEEMKAIAILTVADSIPTEFKGSKAFSDLYDKYLNWKGNN